MARPFLKNAKILKFPWSVKNIDLKLNFALEAANHHLLHHWAFFHHTPSHSLTRWQTDARWCWRRMWKTALTPLIRKDVIRRIQSRCNSLPSRHPHQLHYQCHNEKKCSERTATNQTHNIRNGYSATSYSNSNATRNLPVWIFNTNLWASQIQPFKCSLFKPHHVFMCSYTHAGISAKIQMTLLAVCQTKRADHVWDQERCLLISTPVST